MVDLGLNKSSMIDVAADTGKKKDSNGKERVERTTLVEKEID